MAGGVCRGCFMECRSYEMVSEGFSRPYPCPLPLRMWAARHRSDRGDGFGYVVESDDDEAVDDWYVPQRGRPVPQDVRERWVALIEGGYASDSEAAQELGVNVGTVRRWLREGA